MPRPFLHGRAQECAVVDRMVEAARTGSSDVLVVRGERDVVAPQRWCEELVAALPQGELAVVAGAPHATNFTHPHEVAALVMAHVRRHRP